MRGDEVTASRLNIGYRGKPTGPARGPARRSASRLAVHRLSVAHANSRGPLPGSQRPLFAPRQSNALCDTLSAVARRVVHRPTAGCALLFRKDWTPAPPSNALRITWWVTFLAGMSSKLV